MWNIIYIIYNTHVKPVSKAAKAHMQWGATSNFMHADLMCLRKGFCIFMVGDKLFIYLTR